MNVSFGGVAYAYTEADIDVDPVLQLEEAEMELHTWAAKFIHTFELFDKSARVDFTQGYQEAEWEGVLDGAPASANREGLSDTFVRVAVNLYGSPPLSGKEFSAYRAGSDSDTIVGIGLAVRLPTGNYLDDKLLNLGGNRFVFRPQFGVSHNWGLWTAEITTEVSIFTENDEFWDGNKLEQDPLYIVHGHLIYTFRPGLWLSASAGYDYGGESQVNGVNKGDKKQNVGWGIKAAYPINRRTGVNLSYVNTRTQQSTGMDSDTLLASLSYMW